MGLTFLLGFLPGFKLPGFLKSPLFWKVAAMVAAAFFIWHKATISANARWQLELIRQKTELRTAAAKENAEQHDDDMKRIFELENINHDLRNRNFSLAKRRSKKKNTLPKACTMCRVPRGRSPRRVR